MNFEGEDKLELQHLAGGNIVTQEPVFSEQGRFLFLRSGLKVLVFVSRTGELTRELTGATAPMISLELELNQPEVLVGCTSTGQLLRWHWRTGVLQKTTPMRLKGGSELQVATCNFLNLYKEGDTACAFVTAKRRAGQKLLWFVVNTSTGAVINIECGLQLKVRTPQVDVGKKGYKYIVISQGYYVYFVNYDNWQFIRYKNANCTLVTCIRFSPAEEAVATGDEQGRILIWRQFGNHKTMKNALYHWHHTAVTSIAFTPTGANFYSSGMEAVLVKWSMARPQHREFVPRMSSIIRHVIVSDGNEHIAVCTDDNAVQFVGPTDQSLISSLQHFTYSVPDKTGKSLFPLGLCLNPRTNTLVLNGRVGHLQFYSAYTKSLLYNLRVVKANVLNYETDRIIYNTRVTRAAFNIDWMATGEVYNDEKNFTEVRLKFWLYNEKLQRYILNTHIEMPHQYGFKSITFSNQFQVDHLRCATIGKDHVIKLWGIAKSENIYKGGTMWNCLAQTSYKNFPIESICFSQDGSVLAAGYGNTLCIYDARTLALVHALTPPGGYDGVASKVQLRLSKTPLNGARKELTDQRQKLWTILKTLLISDDQKLVQEANQLIAAAPRTILKPDDAPLDDKGPSIFKYIMQMPELSLHQKLQLFRSFGIECSIPEQCCKRLVAHLQSCVVPSSSRFKFLGGRLQRISLRHRFKAKQRLTEVKTRQQQYEQIVNEEVLPLLSVLQLDTQTQPAIAHKRKRTQSTATPKPRPVPCPMQSLAEISHVQFGAGGQAHLVTVCTDSRVLIWNLMTLRLQAGLKLSVKHVAFDPQTNLLAVVTRNQELHVFQPNVPLPVYQRFNIPKLYGLVWLPRRQPKQSSINIDWQAQSTLHMLTETQEIVYLAPPGVGLSDGEPAPVAFTQPASEMLQYATFGSYALKQQRANDTKNSKGANSGPLIVGQRKTNVPNALINLSAHTMPAMSLICGQFIKSLLTPAETTSRHNSLMGQGQGQRGQYLSNGTVNGNGLPHEGSDVDDDLEADDEVKAMAKSLKARKTLLAQNSTPVGLSSQEAELALEAKLQRIRSLDISLEL
ncbi:WD repeat-containing protein 75 [Scaptodrosophila lebanonensis]|uniref:WD repeat-containing protein 75 n=1 Tax=Drosophila lebanonensis TaxID=7225 RepID=A0A6J2U447_DROLE|nr:WD repeat-containing protein 75 [Scaptodrosophila lebanonensis]